MGMDRFTYISLCLFQDAAKAKPRPWRLFRSQAFWPIVYYVFIKWLSRLASFSGVLLVGTCLRPKKGMQTLTFLSWHFCERSSRQCIEISWTNSLAPGIPSSWDIDLIWHCVECAVTPYSTQYGVESRWIPHTTEHPIDGLCFNRSNAKTTKTSRSISAI